MSNVLRLKALIVGAREIGMDKDKSFESIVRRLSARWDEFLYQKAVDMLKNNNSQNILDTTFPIPVTPDELQAVDAPYKIGVIAGTDIEFGLHPLQLQMHGVLGGGTGYGKSTLIKVLSRQMITEGKTKVWIIDPKEGGDYRFLAKLFDDLVILRSDVLRCNPFGHIKNVPSNTLREAVSDVTADSYGVYDASEAILAEQIDILLKEQDQPTVFDLVRAIGKVKGGYGGRKQGYLDSINSRLTKTVISLRDIINCRTDYFSELYDKNVVFEVGDLSGSAQRFLVPWLILKLTLFKIRNPSKGLSHLLVFDEAQSNLWSRNLELRGRTSTMATLATQCRAFGLGILVLAQNPATQLMTAIIANSCIKLCLRLNSGEEIVPMARHMGLSYEQMQTFYEIDRGEAICRVGLGYFKPTHLQLFNYQDDPISNDELNELMKSRWDKLLEGIEPAITDQSVKSIQSGKTAIEKNSVIGESIKEESSEENPSENSKIMSVVPAGGKPPAPTQHGGVYSTPPTPDEDIYLRMVSRHPWRLITEIYSMLCDEKIMGNDKFSKNRAVNARKKLVSKRLLENFAIPGTGRSGRSYCDMVSEKANMGKVYKPRGGNLHGFFCYRVSKFFEKKGYKAELGSTSTGNEIDVSVLTSDGKRIGVEVVISVLMVENVGRFIDVFDRLIILAIDNRKKREIEKMLSDDISMRIEIGLVRDYFIEL